MRNANDAMLSLLANEPEKAKKLANQESGERLERYFRREYLSVREPSWSPDSQESQEQATLDSQNESVARGKWRGFDPDQRDVVDQVLERSGGSLLEFQESVDPELANSPDWGPATSLFPERPSPQGPMSRSSTPTSPPSSSTGS